MKLIRMAAGVAALVISIVVVPVSLASTASATTARPAGGCADNVDPDSFPDKRTIYFNDPGTGNDIVELRYSSNGCAWGRLRNSTVDDAVWVDRAVSQAEADAGHWEGPLGWTQGGGSDGTVYTNAWNDVGLVMRACADTPYGIECTHPWW